MDDYISASVMHWYEDLESRLLEFLRYVPLVDTNMSMQLPRLAGVITEACSVLDSVLREAAPPRVTTATGKFKERADLDITDYAARYANRLQLPRTNTLVLVSPPRYLIPFEPWAKMTSAETPYVPLPWWQTYTSMKHSRVDHIRQATLGVAVTALCALHQVLARLPDYARAAMRHGWIEVDGWNPEIIIEAIEGGRGDKTFLVQTKLFCVPVGRDGFPDDVSELRPAFFAGSSRLVEFFGRAY